MTAPRVLQDCGAVTCVLAVVGLALSDRTAADIALYSLQLLCGIGMVVVARMQERQPRSGPSG